MVFFLIAGWEWLSRGRRSDSVDRAKEGLMRCGRVMIGRDIVVTDVELKSWRV
jgi:hypothetical protein